MIAMLDRDAPEYIARHYVCPDCRHRSRLVVRWNGKCEEVICHGCQRTSGFVRKVSLMAQWKANPDSVPVQIANIFERKAGYQPMTEQQIVVASEKQMVTRIEGARWLKELTPQDRNSLAHLAVKYGLDPLMKELTLYEGAPYISIAGLIRIAHRQKMFAGLEDRPMSSAERQQYGYKAPFCWLVRVYRKDWRVPAVGTGTADPANPFRNNPIERTRPEWMARSRAIRQALKLAFPHSLPFEEVAQAEDAGIDPETGEIVEPAGEVIDADAQEVPDEPPFEDEAPEEQEAPIATDSAKAEQLLAELKATVEQKGYNWTIFTGSFRVDHNCEVADATPEQLQAALRTVAGWNQKGHGDAAIQHLRRHRGPPLR